MNLESSLNFRLVTLKVKGVFFKMGQFCIHYVLFVLCKSDTGIKLCDDELNPTFTDYVTSD